MRHMVIATVVLAAAAFAPLASGQAPQGILTSFSFDEDTHGFMVVGSAARITIEREPDHIQAGKGSLRFDYAVAKGDVCAMFAPLTGGIPASARSVGFWVKASVATGLACVAQEQGGGRFLAMFAVPKGKWQRVEVAWSDFVLSSGPTDPKDSNGRLDVDLLEGIGLADVAQLLAQAGDGATMKALGLSEGARSLWLDELTVSSRSLPDTPPAANGELTLDPLNRPQLAWLATGGVDLTIADGAPLGMRALKMDYRQAKGQPRGIIRFVPRGSLDGVGAIRFTAAAVESTKLVLQVEEEGGGKYSGIIDIRGGKGAQELSVSLLNLSKSPDSRDPNGRLDRDLIKQIVLIDLTGLFGAGDKDNTLWIGKLRTSNRP